MSGKSVKIDSKSQLKKCENTCQNADDDWISRLPDDILVGILSSLPQKEAARTSILSSRWENLWKHTFLLDFDAHRERCRISKHQETPPILTLARRKYVNWVSHVLRSHKGSALKEFKICFDLDNHSKKAINNWLRHVFERRVERLELDLSEGGDLGRQANVFPIKQFTLHQTPRCCFDFRSLRSLCLKSVGVTDLDIHFFLRSCPLLERLVVHFSFKISNLNICGRALALKHLEICYCSRVKSIKVSAPNLTSLKVSAVRPLLLENVPKLAEVKVVCCGNLQYLVPAFSCCLSQLEILSLHLLVEMNFIAEFKFPLLAKLKKLEIQYRAKGDNSVIALTSILRAAPFCQEFVIKLSWTKVLRRDTNNCNAKNEKHSPHQHLKVVKFLGYYGRSSDVELVWYLLGNCVVLEKLIIDPRYQTNDFHLPVTPDEIDGEITESNYPLLDHYELDELDAVLTARNYAKKQLEGKIPEHVELVIL